MNEQRYLTLRRARLTEELSELDALEAAAAADCRPASGRDIPRMVTVREAARRANLSYHYIRKLCAESKIVHVKAGSKYLINFDSLVEYLKKGEIPDD